MNRLTYKTLLTALALSVAMLLARAAEPSNPDPYANETPAQRDARMAGMLRQKDTTALAVEPRYGPVNNVPEAASYTLLCSLMIPNSAKYNSTGVPYQIDHRAWLSEFRRVAYYMELQQGSEPVRFIWVSMDAFSPDAGKLGVPAAGVGAKRCKTCLMPG